MAYLTLVRHGKSQWNALGLWTGWTDIPLVDEGKEDARKTAESLKDIDIHKAYSSKLKRAKETLKVIQETLNISHIPTVSHRNLNERHYGVFTGKNKWEVQKEVGEEEFQKIRRGWNHKIKDGETLEDVHRRVIPYFQKTILKDLKKGKNIIVVAHGNSLRALVKHLENLSEEEVSDLEIGIAEAYVYEIDSKGNVFSKEIRASNETRGKI